jgi:formylmethanofuran dehydrogenase subunit E
LNETLRQIEKFHGHIGPYAVIGYRMGLIANKKLGSDPFLKKAVVFTGSTPPLSCIVDGIQMSSGCTYGKGNIKVENKGIAKADFFTNEGEKIQILLKKELKNEIDTTVVKENMVSYSEEMFKKSDEELFDII